MKTLFIDTSSSTLTVALLSSGDVICKREIDSINEHSKYAINEIKELFNNSLVKPNELNKIMVINGPGSFTGIRIGVTIAKTFGWSLNVEVTPISTLKAYALSNNNMDYYVSVIDARREHVYSAIYDKNYNAILEDTYISVYELNKKIESLNGRILVIGDITINNINEHVTPKLDVKEIYEYYKNSLSINAHKLIPNYLKRVEAEEKLGCGKND